MVPILDPDQQYALDECDPSPRHKVSNNLPGTPAFCPLVRRTPDLVAFSEKALGERAREAMGRVRPDLVARAAVFILLNDSKSSFAIEGERPSGQRAARWGQAIAQAGMRPLNLDELDRLQRIVIGDARFVRLGLRDEGGFIGVNDRDTNMFLNQNGGRLSQRACTKEFAALDEVEVERIEALYADGFERD
ncbi:hypothetical protein [Rhizobium sp. RCC_161_2]|uniref:hypothetical protein n=1 Tax=Rhizobium sp. RCC_161_2 TaxID=3239219 RepID=UPI003526341F